MIKNMKEMVGVTHLHTPYSDGNSSFKVYGEISSELGLDFCAFTDHMTLKPKSVENISENGVFFLIGYEHNDRDGKNHCLVFGTDSVADGEVPKDYLKSIRDLGGISILAHPDEKRHYFSEYPAYPWTEWQLNNFDGIELWNQFSVWVERLETRFSYINILFPRRLTTVISPELLKKWDKINLDRFVFGTGGVDAHTLKRKLLFFNKEIFPLKVELSGVRQHLYIEDKTLRDEDTVVNLQSALSRGNGFISNFRRGDARGTRIILSDKNGNIFLPGINSKKPILPATINITIPKIGRVVLIKNGKKIGEFKDKTGAFNVESNGTYRVEVYKKKYGWIYSNHFIVGSYPFSE